MLKKKSPIFYEVYTYKNLIERSSFTVVKYETFDTEHKTHSHIHTTCETGSHQTSKLPRLGLNLQSSCLGLSQ